MRAKDLMTPEKLKELGLDQEPSLQRLDEGGKPVPIDKRTTARTDIPAHGGGGQIHTHFDTKGQPERIINKDGTASHGTGPFTLSDKEIAYLNKKKHTVPPNGLVESLNTEARKCLDGYRQLNG